MEAVLQEVQPAFKKEARSDIPVKVWDLKDWSMKRTREKQMEEKCLTVTVARHRC